MNQSIVGLKQRIGYVKVRIVELNKEKVRLKGKSSTSAICRIRQIENTVATLQAEIREHSQTLGLSEDLTLASQGSEKTGGSARQRASRFG